MKKSSNVMWGIVLILIAAYVVVRKLGIISDLPIMSIIISVVCLYLVVKGIIKVNFYEIFIPIAVIGCLFSDFISHNLIRNFDVLTPWPILLVSILLAGGLSLIFKREKNVEFSYCSETAGSCPAGTESDSWIKIKSSFDGSTRYVNSQCLEGASIENNFGQNIIYFNNAVMKNGSIRINVENNFGQTVIYLPNTWRLDLERNNALGAVTVKGTGNTDPDAPVVHVRAKNAFGEVSINFE